MADDSLEVQKDDVPFHPCLTPRGMTWYDLNVLTPLQQKLLNEFKVDVVRENNQYLARHPEVRAIVALFLRAILNEQPKIKSIADFAKDFFTRPLFIIQEEIDDYLKHRGEPLKKEGDSALNLADLEVSSERSTIEDLTSLYHQDYYTYISYTDEPSVEEVEAWGAGEDVGRVYKSPSFGDQTFYTSTTEISGIDYERRQFELLFASRATLYSGESVEASTIDMTKDYMTYVGGVPQSTDALLTDREDELSKLTFEEIKSAEEIEGKLSIILEHVEEEDVLDEYAEYEEDLNEIADVESIMGEENILDEAMTPSPSEKTSASFDTTLDDIDIADFEPIEPVEAIGAEG